MNSEKRKRTDFTLEQKRAIIEAAKRESNQTKLAKDFTMKQDDLGNQTSNYKTSEHFVVEKAHEIVSSFHNR
uniref:Transposase n=1 Tax=Ditylenchus dipsaci TaxID=166011 RepID=A0A915CS78_9BILA